MNHTFHKIVFAFIFATGLFSCKKSKDETPVQPPPPPQFQSFTLKLGTDSIAVSIDNATKTIKNMPRNYDVKQLIAAAVLPAGYSISPNPSTVQDYTNGVTFTITTDKGQKYTAQVTVPPYDAAFNPYGIYTAKQLSDVRNGLNDSYVLMNDIQLPDMTASNGAAQVNISDYAQHGWYSIGARYVDGGNVTFRGSLDGQNHVIKNLTSIRPDGTPMPTGIDAGHNAKGSDGLFGWAIGATFKNIGIQLAATGINDATSSGGLGFVGALAGEADSSTITNCYVTGNATVSASQYVGGLIGKVQYSTISKCHAVLTTAGGNYGITSGGGEAGGLIGWALLSNISDSYASCSIMSSIDAGGFIGSINSCSVKTCYASGNVSEIPYNDFGSLIAPNFLGGLIGSAKAVSSSSPSTIQNCYATGAVAGANGTNSDFHKSSHIGGLVGEVSTLNGPVSVSYCYATGSVTRVWSNASEPYLIGALAGNTPNGVFITSAVCTNYWDKTTTGQANLGGASTSLAQDNGFTANGKTTAEMKTNATYSNWDFSSIWNVAAGTNNGYPYLRSVN